MSQPPDDGQRPEGQPLPDPTAPDWSPPLPPWEPPRAPSNPYAAPSNPYAAPSNPYAAAPAPPGNPYATGNPYLTGGAPGHPPVAPPPYGYQQVPQQQTNVSAIVLLILSGLMVCCVVQIPATILAIIALTKQNADPTGSRRLTKYGWVVFGVGIILAVVVVAIIASSGASFDDTPSGGYSY